MESTVWIFAWLSVAAALSVVLMRAIRGERVDDVPQELGLRYAPAWRYALSMALLTGIVEGVYGLGRLELFDLPPAELKEVGPHTVWMTAADHVALALLLSAVLLTLLPGLRASVREPLFSFAFPFVGLLSVFGASGRLGVVAGGLLAAGIAARIAAGRPLSSIRFRSLTRKSLGVGVGAVAVLGTLPILLGSTRTPWSGARATASLDRPNVLLLVLDTQRWFNMGLHGYDRSTTPNLDRFATGGVTFDRAISPAPWTLPAHASLFTGRWPHETGVSFTEPLDRTFPTLAEVLAANGYRTGGFSANLQFVTPVYGVDRGFDVFRSIPLSWMVIARQAWILRRPVQWLRERRDLHDYLVLPSARTVNDWFLDWVDRKDDAPFFAFLNYFEPHEPYAPARDLAGTFGSKEGLNWLARGNLSEAYSPDELENFVALYDEDVLTADRAFGELLNELDARGLLENTLVVVTSDHGEEFGERGKMNHVETVHATSVRVPLIVVYPERVPPGRRIEPPVSTRDVPATILELVGIPPSGVAGPSLVPTWERNQDPARPVFAEHGLIRSVFTRELHLVKYGQGLEQLYDWNADPLELHDLAPSRPADRARLSSLLESPAPMR
jgi:arylsulfatase A-like enzyme